MRVLTLALALPATVILSTLTVSTWLTRIIVGKAVAFTIAILDVTFCSLFGATALLIYTFIVPILPEGLDGQGRLDLSIFPDDPDRALRTPGSSRILKRPTSHASIGKSKKVFPRSAMNKTFFSSTARHHHQLVPRRAPPPPPSTSSRLKTPTRLPPILSLSGHRDPNTITPSPPHLRGVQHRVRFTAVPARTVALRSTRAVYGSLRRGTKDDRPTAEDVEEMETALSKARKGVERSWFPSSPLASDTAGEASGSGADQMVGADQKRGGGVMTPPSSPEIIMDLALVGDEGGEEGGVVVGGSAARRRRREKGKGRALAGMMGGQEQEEERHGLGLGEMGLE